MPLGDLTLFLRYSFKKIFQSELGLLKSYIKAIQNSIYHVKPRIFKVMLKALRGLASLLLHSTRKNCQSVAVHRIMNFTILSPD